MTEPIVAVIEAHRCLAVMTEDHDCGNDTHKTTMWHAPIVAGCGGYEYVMQ